MAFRKGWVSGEGRLSQRGYVLTFALPFLATLAFTTGMFVSPDGFATLGVAGIYVTALGWLLVMALGDALNIKRYHDLGHSGRLYRLCRPGIVVLPLLAFALDFLIPSQMAATGDMNATLHMIAESVSPTMDPAPTALLAITVAGVAVNVAYLSLMPGQRGPNEHGPDPLGTLDRPCQGLRKQDRKRRAATRCSARWRSTGARRSRRRLEVRLLQRGRRQRR